MTSEKAYSESGKKCVDCGRTHDDWESIGDRYTVNSKHHSGWGQTVECGYCGGRDEVTGR